MNHHKEEERLNGPEVEAVEEVPDGRGVPPLRPKGSQHHTGEDQEDEAGDGGDTEEVDIAANVGGLFGGEQLLVGEVFGQGELGALGQAHGLTSRAPG